MGAGGRATAGRAATVAVTPCWGSGGHNQWRRSALATTATATSRVSLEKSTSHQGVAFLTLTNARERNALSVEALEELKATLADVESHRSFGDVRVVVLRAQGPVFSAGHNVKEMRGSERDPAYFARCFALCSEVMQAVRGLRVPVIAQVDGLATAAGAQLVASCDLVVATEDSHFATPGVKIGLFCTTPAVALGRAINSEKKMMEMLLTGEPITAQEAHTYGLVNKVVPKAQIEEATLELAKKIVSYSPSVIGLGKKAFYQQMAQPDISQAYKFAEGVMCANAVAEDAYEGMSAFVEKRKPTWKPTH